MAKDHSMEMEYRKDRLEKLQAAGAEHGGECDECGCEDHYADDICPNCHPGCPERGCKLDDVDVEEVN